MIINGAQFIQVIVFDIKMKDIETHLSTVVINKNVHSWHNIQNNVMG